MSRCASKQGVTQAIGTDWTCHLVISPHIAWLLLIAKEFFRSNRSFRDVALSGLCDNNDLGKAAFSICRAKPISSGEFITVLWAGSLMFLVICDDSESAISINPLRVKHRGKSFIPLSIYICV